MNAQPILLTAHRMFSPVAHVLKHTKRKGVPCTPPPAPRKQTPSATVPSHISAAMALMLGRRCLFLDGIDASWPKDPTRH